MATANTTIARPYAKAIFELALAQGKLGPWSTMLQLLAQICAHPQMLSIINHPAILPQQLVEMLLEITGKQLTEEAGNLVKLLAANKRLRLLPEISMLYELQRAEQEHTIEVEVVTAMPLTAAQQQQLSLSLRQRLQREVNLNIKIDNSILGGAIIHAGDLVIDGSLRSKLNRLSSAVAA